MGQPGVDDVLDDPKGIAGKPYVISLQKISATRVLQMDAADATGHPRDQRARIAAQWEVSISS